MFRIKYSREIILKLLYQLDLLDNFDYPVEKLLNDNFFFFKNINEIEKEYIFKIINAVIDKKESIDELISENLIGWKLKRFNPIDRNLLRMGIAESYSNEKKIVIIDDIVRIAKKYGGEDSFKIINAVLDKVIQ
ncbi:MAG: transcription antitermination factor NusB [Acidobacteriota bacterium]